MSKIKDCAPVIEKFKSRLSSWKMRSLSFGGRVVLVKSVLNSLPLYYFSLFRASSSVIKILESVRRNFFWGGSGSGHAMEELQVSFKHSFIKTIRRGDSTSFWLEHWIGIDKLCNMFPRIFQLESEKEARIADRVKARDNGVTFEWCWIREPNGRTNSELQVLTELIAGFPFCNCSTDRWSWSLASNDTFTVKKLSTLLESNFLAQFSAQDCTLKNSFDLWIRMSKWWGLHNFNPTNLKELLEEEDADSMTIRGKKLWQAIIWIGLYHIWSLRNEIVFQNKTWNIPMAFSVLQSKAFEWISSRDRKHSYDWLEWISNPSVLLTTL
ncbi:uncharacterized protein [Rutidosis leptorrhynchoides]|uniref:uncharacterized protein n=1 Tax=Rutidosis leptorrhynchoides TaxID=125765 RepID=UPI003A99C13E